MFQQILSSLSPEQQTLLIGGFITLLLTGIAAGGALFRLWFLQKLADNKAEMQIKIDDTEAKNEQKQLEIQARLDSTQSTREVIHMQSIELIESRNAYLEIIKTNRSDAQKRDEQFTTALKEIVAISQNIQANTASNLEVLKLHAESDNVMNIRQEKIIKQNESTHIQLLELASSLDTVIIKVDTFANGHLADKKILEDMRGALVLIQSGISHLEDALKPKFDDTIDLSNSVKELSEQSKEFSEKD